MAKPLSRFPRFVYQICFLCVSIVIIMAIACFTFGSCMKCPLKEGLQNILSKEESMGMDIEKSVFDIKPCRTEWTDFIWSTPDKDSNLSQLVLPNESLVFSNKTEKRPDCCRNTCGIKKEQESRVGISRTSGCPCHSNEQIRYIRMRGGNRTPGDPSIGMEDNIMD